MYPPFSENWLTFAHKHRNFFGGVYNRVFIANAAAKLYISPEPGEEIQGYVSDEQEASDDELDENEY